MSTRDQLIALHEFWTEDKYLKGASQDDGEYPNCKCCLIGAACLVSHNLKRPTTPVLAALFKAALIKFDQGAVYVSDHLGWKAARQVIDLAIERAEV